MVQGFSNTKTKDFKNQVCLKEREIYEGNNRRDGRKSLEDSGEKRTGRDFKAPPNSAKEKGDIVYQALGWLAREEKILFHKKEGRILYLPEPRRTRKIQSIDLKIPVRRGQVPSYKSRLLIKGKGGLFLFEPIPKVGAGIAG